MRQNLQKSGVSVDQNDDGAPPLAIAASRQENERMDETLFMNELNGSREAELSCLLKIFGVEYPIAGRSVGMGYFITELNDFARQAYRSEFGSPVLLSFQVGDCLQPLSIFFIEQRTHRFGHSALLLDSYAEGDAHLLSLQQALQTFFTRSEDLLMGALNPLWLSVKLKGVVDKRPLWEQQLGEHFIPQIAEAVTLPRLPVLPSVYHFNNPYMRNLLEMAMPLLKEGDRVLTMGCGAGAETVYLASKTRSIVDAVDINPLAVLNTQMTAHRAGLGEQVSAWTSDIYSKVYEKYDLIFFNAPLAVPVRPEGDPNRFDFEGRMLRNVLEGLPNFLNPGGRLLVMSNPQIEEYLPANLSSKILKKFTAVIESAIHEISLNRTAPAISLPSDLTVPAANMTLREN